MKKIIKLLTLCLLILSMAGICLAEESEGNLYYNSDDGSDFIVNILYENPDISVKLKDPDDKTVKLDNKNVSVMQNDEAGSMIILVRKAKEGQWKLVYDKGSNESLKVKAVSYETPIWIEKLKVSGPDDDTIKVSFDVTQEEGRSFNYEVRISNDPEFSVFRTIHTGYSNVDERTEAEVSLADVNDGDEYYLKILVYYEKDDTVYFDEIVSEPFSYKNPGAVEAPADFKLSFDDLTGMVTIDLSSSLSWDTTDYNLRISEDGTETYNSLINKEETGTVISLPYKETTKNVEVAVSGRLSNGRVTPETVKTANVSTPSDGLVLSLPESGMVGTNYCYINYSNADHSVISLKMNEEWPVDIELDGSGRYKLELPDEQNSFTVSYTSSDNVVYSFDRVISVDNIPPSLTVYESLNGIQTDKDSITVTGKTDPGSKVTMNGNEVEVAENGTFTYDAPISEGSNTLSFSSEDEVGNIATYVLKVNKGEEKTAKDAEKEDGGSAESAKAGKIAKMAPLLLALLGSVCGIAEIVAFLKGKKKGNKGVKLLSPMFLILTIASAAAFIGSLVVYLIRRGFEKSEKYIDLSLNAPKEAYKYLQTTKTNHTLVIVFGIICGVALLAFLICFMIKKLNSPERIEAKKAAKEAAMKRKAEEAEARARAAEEKAKAEEPKFKFCTGCGNKLEFNAKFCTKCGKKQ